ncbi:nitrate- and nitrite sensing domain-containing protein [Streptomyces sp. NPDC057386]|uniref:nitrate- and nitrite sensing domain-containing protein n=1 Tax=Streptomyces sp. NPDC057386 TaxID=3346114 RepID=UPI00363ECEE5
MGTRHRHHRPGRLPAPPGRAAGHPAPRTRRRRPRAPDRTGRSGALHDRPSDRCADDLRTPTERTDRTVTALRLGDRHTVAQREELPAEVARRLGTFVTSAAQLRTLRAEILARRTGWDTAHARYTAAVFAAFGVDALTRVQDAGRGTDARVLLESLRAADALAQEDTVLTGAPHRRTARRTAAAALHRRRTVTDTAAEDPMSLVESAGRMHTARLLKSVG